jgi:hypothetical protein
MMLHGILATQCADKSKPELVVGIMIMSVGGSANRCFSVVS